jgi:Domain of unknown function (DUF5615)
LKLLLDEHLSPVVAIELRRLGYDAICVAEVPQLRGLDDAPLIRWATADERVLVSADRATMPSAAEVVRGDGGHAGVVIVSPDRYSLSKRNPGPLIAVLARVAGSTGHDHHDRVTWL